MKEYHVLNLGAGVQSTCLYLLKKIKFDCAIFADTQEEPEDVYKHLEWLKGINDPKILIRTAGKLGDDLIHGTNSTGHRFASIPAFVFTEGAKRESKLRRQCTSEYKIEVIERTIRYEIVGIKPRQWMPRNVMVYQYFGITVDEKIRAEKSKKRFEKLWWAKPVYPFLDMGWTRQDCVEWLADKVPHKTPRSACTFCPYHSNAEWLSIKTNDPVGWARAVEIDNALRTEGTRANAKLDGVMYLHRKCVPLETIDFASEIDRRFCGEKESCDEGVCFI